MVAASLECHTEQHKVIFPKDVPGQGLQAEGGNEADITLDAGSNKHCWIYSAATAWEGFQQSSAAF